MYYSTGYVDDSSLFKTFAWEKKSTTIDTRGKPGLTWAPNGQIVGVLSDAKPEDKLKYSQMQHNITHQIASRGSPQAEPNDRLTFNGSHYYVQDVQDPGNLGLWTLYMVEERKDI